MGEPGKDQSVAECILSIPERLGSDGVAGDISSEPPRQKMSRSFSRLLRHLNRCLGFDTEIVTLALGAGCESTK